MRYWRHKVRGSQYAEIARGTLQVSSIVDVLFEDFSEADRAKIQQRLDGQPLVIYRSLSEPSRPPDARLVPEFGDGRFEEIRPVPRPVPHGL